MLEDINDKFARSKVGNCEVIIMKKNGYVNATKLCKEFGKKFANWYIIMTTKELIKVLEEDSNKKVMIQITTGSRYETHLRGTYVHPLLVTNIANWISPIFALKISKWVDEWRNYSDINNQKYWNAIGNLEPSSNDQKELAIKLKLNKTLKGKLEAEIDDEFIDILTDNKVIEVKTAKLYKQALGQVLAYGIHYPDRQKVIYLFDLDDNFNVKKVKKLYRKYDVKLKIIDNDFV